jgi:hypothetical protein
MKIRRNLTQWESVRECYYLERVSNIDQCFLNLRVRIVSYLLPVQVRFSSRAPLSLYFLSEPHDEIALYAKRNPTQ